MCFLFLCVDVFLQVAYLDRVDFGLKSLPDVVPRVLVWKGTRIRDYADLDKCSGNSFGKRPLKHVSYASKVQVISCFCSTLFYFLISSSSLQ
jgi:hypothetical protein